MAKNYYVKNVTKTQACFNLSSTDEKGMKLSLILSPREISRPLSETEFQSSEIQKAIGKRGLVDATALAGRQR
jgi:hypothetical protein